MVKTIECKPNKKQKLFFKAKNKYIAYGGARGGGKSWAMRMKCVLLALNYSNLKILLLRRTFPELEANHILPLQLILKDIATYVVSKKIFVFPNGSFIKLGYCKSEADSMQYHGHEYDVICFEEATHFTEYQLTFIATCARNVRPDFAPRIYYTCNPGNVGHAYIKRLFIDREFEGNEKPEQYTFIPALVYDNEMLMKYDPEYISVLDNMPEELRKAHRDGDWDVLSGQYFREFRKKIHVIEPFEIPRSWTKYVTIDYGLDMTAVYWIAVDYEGLCYAYRELHVPNLIVSDACKMIRDSTPPEEYIDSYYLPPDMAARRQDTGRTALEIFQDNGIPGIICKNDRIDGWLVMKEMMKIMDNGTPQLYFFNTCKMAIKHIPLIQRDEKNPNDTALEPHNITHAPDAIRYFCQTYVELPVHEQTPISGTWYRGELLMKGYSHATINKFEKQGLIKVI